MAGKADETKPSARLRPDGTLGDVLTHPSLAPFGKHLMPWPRTNYDLALPLRQFDSLLPYHSNVTAQQIVPPLNRLIDDVENGQQVFYDIYDAEALERDSAKRETGLFFFRGKPGAPFAIIAPGGGFAYVGSVHEGFPYANAINDAGLNAFVVRYRVRQGQMAATEDMAAAIALIFSRAEELGVSTAGYSVWGSSAGARMAALMGSYGPGAFGAPRLPRPSAVIMAYTSHNDLAETEPPTYVIVGERDGIAPPSNMRRRVDALRSLGTTVEFRIVPGIGHGFGNGAGTAAAGWIADAVRFWQANG